MFTMLKKGAKYIPSYVLKKDSNIPNSIDKTIKNKLEEFNRGNVNFNSDYYNDTYRIEKSNCSNHRKAFIVEYVFTYDEPVTKATDEVMDGTSLLTHKAIMEKDVWSADSVEQAILYTYQNFGKSYRFNQKYGSKKNITFCRIFDVYVKLHYSYIPECYTNRYSTWNQQFCETSLNNEFRNYCESESCEKE